MVIRLLIFAIFCVSTVNGEFLSPKKFREEVEHGDVDSEDQDEEDYENQESDYFLRDHSLQERRIPRNPVR